MAPRSILSAARAHYGDDECAHNVRRPTLRRRRGDAQEGLRARATSLTDDEAPQPARAPSWPYRPSQPQARPPQRLRSCSARSSALDSPPCAWESTLADPADSTTMAMYDPTRRESIRGRHVGAVSPPGDLDGERRIQGWMTRPRGLHLGGPSGVTRSHGDPPHEDAQFQGHSVRGHLPELRQGAPRRLPVLPVLRGAPGRDRAGLDSGGTQGRLGALLRPE